MTLRIGWKSQHLCQRKRGIGWEVNLLDAPVGIFFGQRPEQTQQTGMGRIAYLGGMQRAHLVGDHRPA